MHKRFSLLILGLILLLPDGTIVVTLASNSFSLNSIENGIVSCSFNEITAHAGTLFYNWTSEACLIDDSDDELSKTDIQKGYVACDGEFIYMLWTRLRGSHIDEFYFDVNYENGYEIGSVRANYLLTPFSEDVICEWNGKDFLPLNLTFRWYDSVHGSEDGKIAYHGWGENFELKIALSILGDPTVTKIFYKVKYWGEDKAPDGSFILIFSNQTQVFVASLNAKPLSLKGKERSDVAYLSGDGFNATFKIINFGSSSIGPLNVRVDVPDGMNTNLNQTSWTCLLDSEESWASLFRLRSQRLGESTVLATICYQDSGTGSFHQTLPLTILTIPNMTIHIHPTIPIKAGFCHTINISLTNYDPVWVEAFIDLDRTHGAEYWVFQPITLELGPNSLVKFQTKIAPRAIINPEYRTSNSTTLTIVAKYKNYTICLSKQNIIISEPNVEITVKSENEVRVGDVFYVKALALNYEDEEILVALKAFLSSWASPAIMKIEEDDYKELLTTIQPNSNVTTSFKFKAIKEGEAKIVVTVWHGIDYVQYGVDIIVTPSWIELGPFILIIMIVTLLAVAVVFYRKHRKKNSPSYKAR